MAHDSSAKYASIFFSLFLLSLVESPPLESHDQAVPYFFYTRLPSSPPPLFSVFNVCFLPFSLSHSFPHSLSPKGGNAGKIDSNISEIVIRSRSTHCSEIDGRIYVFAWVEGRERIHREQLDRNT